MIFLANISTISPAVDEFISILTEKDILAVLPNVNFILVNIPHSHLGEWVDPSAPHFLG
jgi:hypothetical protein